MPMQDPLKPSMGARSPLPAGYGPELAYPTPLASKFADRVQGALQWIVHPKQRTKFGP